MNIATQAARATDVALDRLVPISTAQQQLGVSRSKLYQLLGEGDLPRPVKIGRRTFFSERELQVWISARLGARTEGGVMNAITPGQMVLPSTSRKATLKALLTLFTSLVPASITKQFRLDGGVLIKEAGGNMSRGRAERVEVASLAELGELVASLGPNQALGYGIADLPLCEVVARWEWEKLGRPADPIARTKDHFTWPDGPAILMLDYDPADPLGTFSGDDLINLLRAAVPALSQVELLWVPSASSCIHDRDSGREVRGLCGQRVYVILRDGRDIERVGRLIHERLWLAGHGYFRVSKAGALLERSLIDTAVWQPNRLDFAAGAHCHPPLEQRRGKPRLFSGDMQMLDSRTGIPDLSASEQKGLHLLKQAARAEKAEEAASVRAAWIESRVRHLAGDDADETAVMEACAELVRALDERVLPLDFQLEVQIDGKIETVTIRDVFRDPERFNGAETRDPIEPDYDDGRLVGMLFLGGRKKTLHSFARGETTYVLADGRQDIKVHAGQLAAAVDETLEVLRDRDDLFDRDEDLVHLVEGRLRLLDRHSLDQYLGTCVQYLRPKETRGANGWVPCNPPADLSKRVLSIGATRQLKPLLGVISAPTLRPDGSILAEPGYDPETQLFLHLPSGQEMPKVPTEPSIDDARQAVATVMAPFDKFPFFSSLDRSVLMAALLTASVRGSLPTAPAFGFDAPVQGSGKTLLASCVGALAIGERPPVFPHTDGRTDEEVRKRLLALFSEGSGAIVWDNIVGRFDSAGACCGAHQPDVHRQDSRQVQNPGGAEPCHAAAHRQQPYLDGRHDPPGTGVPD